jgi:hypothetical protein
MTFRRLAALAVLLPALGAGVWLLVENTAPSVRNL